MSDNPNYPWDDEDNSAELPRRSRRTGGHPADDGRDEVRARAARRIVSNGRAGEGRPDHEADDARGAWTRQGQAEGQADRDAAAAAREASAQGRGQHVPGAANGARPEPWAAYGDGAPRAAQPREQGWSPYGSAPRWRPGPQPAPWETTEPGPAPSPRPPPRRDLRAPLVLAAAALAVTAVAVSLTFIAAGGEEVTIPVVRGQELATANNVLQGLGLRTVIAAPAADAEVPEGAVVGTLPAAGTTLREGEVVTLTASSGPEPAVVPTIVGQSESAARTTLQDAGLAVSFRAEEPSGDVPEGVVLRAEPPAGSRVEPGEAVTLVISSGPDPIVLPRVIGLQEDEATEQLTSAGLEVEVQFVGQGPPGEVLDQQPDPGVALEAGDSVVLVVGGG